jgi:geranylgeranyl pyrophosphate synthase
MAQFLGPMFQIIDDIIDLTDGKGRDSVGSDIREGKRSYLVAYTARVATPAERQRMFDILDKPRQETTMEDIREIWRLFERHEVIEAGRAYCWRLFEESKAILAMLPKRLADRLGPFFEMLVHRDR